MMLRFKKAPARQRKRQSWLNLCGPALWRRSLMPENVAHQLDPLELADLSPFLPTETVCSNLWPPPKPTADFLQRFVFSWPAPASGFYAGTITEALFSANALSMLRPVCDPSNVKKRQQTILFSHFIFQTVSSCTHSEVPAKEKQETAVRRTL